MDVNVEYALSTSLLIAAQLGLSGCGETTNPVDFVPSETESDGNLTTGVGGSGGVAAGCLLFPAAGKTGVIHRCEGDVSAIFEAEVQGDPISQDFIRYFGDPVVLDDPDDNFENPQVMACCDPLDPPLDPFDEDYKEHLASTLHYKACYHDLIEQGCRSMVFHLRELADELQVGTLKVEKLSNWVAANQQSCRDAFWPSVVEWEYSPSDEYLELEGEWHLPDGTISNGWNGIDNIVVRLSNSPPNRIYSVNLPADEADWNTCESQLENHDNVFAIADDPIDDFVLESGSVDLDGPPIPPSSERIVGTASLKSTDTGCELCSTLSHVPNGSNKTIDYLLLDTEEAEVGTSSETLVVERARIMLYEPVLARTTGFNKWTVAEGEATFVLSGFAEGEGGVVSAHNSTPINLRWTSLFGWRILAFEIEYVDSSSETWTISVGTLNWE